MVKQNSTENNVKYQVVLTQIAIIIYVVCRPEKK